MDFSMVVRWQGNQATTLRFLEMWSVGYLRLVIRVLVKVS